MSNFGPRPFLDPSTTGARPSSKVRWLGRSKMTLNLLVYALEPLCAYTNDSYLLYIATVAKALPTPSSESATQLTIPF